MPPINSRLPRFFSWLGDGIWSYEFMRVISMPDCAAATSFERLQYVAESPVSSMTMCSVKVTLPAVSFFCLCQAMRVERVHNVVEPIPVHVIDSHDAASIIPRPNPRHYRTAFL